MYTTLIESRSSRSWLDATGAVDTKRATNFMADTKQKALGADDKETADGDIRLS